jgi:phosphodiesterase/alkaline phosphatase D-like protein
MSGLAGLNRRVGQQTPLYGTLTISPDPSSGTVESMWLGAQTATGISVVVKMAAASTIVLDVSDGVGVVKSLGPTATDANNVVRFDVTGLATNVAHTCRVRNASGSAASGAFRTLPAAAGTACSYTIAFAGDAQSGSNHVVFDAVRAKTPLAFIHLGDLHYDNISTNTLASFHTSYNTVLSKSRQAQLYREVPTTYVWDDHDYGGNNANGASASKPAAATAYRARVPHYPLEESTGVYHAFDIGRVRFLVTDQRSAASANNATDNSSKTMLGTAQKTWFKAQLAASPSKLIVWICPRWFQPGTSVGADHWGGFSTERRELADHIKANCHGRVIVLSADLHTLGIDSGANEDFATGGGEPLPTFQAAALDQTPISFGAVFDQGGEFTNTGQFGTMQITDAGGSSISVVWRAFNSAGTQLTSYSFSVSV